MKFLPKDFIETAEGLVFAVVDYGQEDGRLACFLRYQKTSQGVQKLSTDHANGLLRNNYPDYLFYSKCRDAWIHGVPLEKVQIHYQPLQRLQYLLSQQSVENPIFSDLIELCNCFENNGCYLSNVGVTGSILVNAQQESSDIDLVIYQRESFIKWQTTTQLLISKGIIQSLKHSQWQEAYQRRGCTIDFEQYLWHEQRKKNKAMINGRKFDLSLIQQNSTLESQRYQKKGPITLISQVIDDTYAFDYPSVYYLNHPQIKHAVSYIATYSGQAKNGENVKIVGQREVDHAGNERIVVGSDREAKGEFIIVIQQES